MPKYFSKSYTLILLVYHLSVHTKPLLTPGLGTASLSFHLIKCRARLQASRGVAWPLPPPPSTSVSGQVPTSRGDELTKYNAEAAAIFLNKVLRVNNHSCPEALEGEHNKVQGPSDEDLVGRVVCYVCGAKLGTLSVAYHRKKCIRAFNIRQQELPASLQRKLPPPPKLDVPPVLGSKEFVLWLAEYNAKAHEIYMHDVSQPCEVYP